MLLLPICAKTFERLLFNEIFNFFIKNKLISSVQYGFKSGYSYFNQLLSITHEMYKYFDVDFEIKSVFLDESKTFDEVAGLYHLQTNSKWNIGEYTKPFAGFFLKERKVSTWGNINTGVHQDIKVPSLVLCCFLFTLVILKKASLPMLSCLQMILLYFLLYMTLKHLQMISIKIWK